MSSIRPVTFVLICLLSLEVFGQTDQLAVPGIVGKKTETTPRGDITTGKFRVFENREANSGHMIHLDFVVLHSTSESPQPDPFFFLVGGPGQAATSVAGQFANHWIRQNRDVVMINQRGTGGDNHLAFEFKKQENVLQQFLDPVIDEATVKTNLERLRQKFDLRMYSTPMAMDDLNDFRQAMGYKEINIAGGSYGTRACLVYLRQHGETVRTATLSGCAPVEFRNPLYHAEAAQLAIDQLFEEVNSNPKYREAFGNLKTKFEEISNRLEKKPATVEIMNQSTGKPESIMMDRNAFLASVRFQMYYVQGSRGLPKLLNEAHQGDFRPFVLSALQRNIALRKSIAMGMLLSVTTAEDVLRMNPNEVDPLTRQTFFGEDRVRAQMAAAAIWPISKLPVDFDQPVRSDVPTLIFSGTIDPVTPPKWGELVHKKFPNSRHIVVPTAHDIGGSCVEAIKKEFLKTGSINALPLDCVKQMKLPPLAMPKS